MVYFYLVFCSGCEFCAEPHADLSGFRSAAAATKTAAANHSESQCCGSQKTEFEGTYLSAKD